MEKAFKEGEDERKKAAAEGRSLVKEPYSKYLHPWQCPPGA